MLRSIKNASTCTLGLALALATGTAFAYAASHCQGRSEADCAASAACKWIAAVKAGDLTRKGTPRKLDAKAHCRLDVKAAAAIAAQASKK